MQKFSIFPENETFCFQKSLAAFPPPGCTNRHFSIRKKLLDCHAMHLFSCRGNQMVDNGQKVKIDLIRIDNQVRFPQTNWKDFCRQGVNQQLCF